MIGLRKDLNNNPYIVWNTTIFIYNLIIGGKNEIYN